MTAGLIGRDRELSRLRDGMRDPDIGAIVLRGPAGAGKSALAEVLAAEAMADGALVGSRKYAEGENQSAFRPVVEALAEAVSRALSQLYDPAAGLESLRQALGPGLAVLGQSGFRVEGLAILAAREIAGERQAAVRLVSAALRAVDWLRGFGLPILLLLDDWRRSGPQGRRLFMALLGRAAEANLRLVLTERDDLAPDPLASRADVLTLEIGELGTSDRLALFAQRLESEEAAATVVDWLGPDCPSLPFDILQAAEAFQAGGAVRRTAGGWRLDPRRVADLHRPDLVRGLVRRLQDLPERARRTALALGLWGDEAPVGWLAHALGCDGQELDAATVRLQGIGLVRRQGETLQFRHDRLRQGVLDAGGPAERRAIASQMADRLGDAADAGAGEVLEPALHLRLMGGDDAGLSAKWRGRFARGAAEARARVDGLAADRYAEAAFRLRERPPSTDRAEQRLILREAMFAAANRNDAEATLSRARLLLDASAGQGELAQAYEAGAVALRLADDLSVSWALGREGLARLGFRLPPTASKSALALAAIRWRLGRLCAPRAAIAVAEGMSRDDYTRVAHVAATAVYERDPDMAALVALRGLALEPRSGSRSAYWLAVETFVCASLGEFERAAELGELVVSSPIRTGFGDAATLYRALYWGLIWRRPQAELRPRCDEVRDLAIAEGDLVHAAIAIRNRLLLGWRTCASLEALRGEIEEARRDVAMIGEPAAQLLLDELDGVVSRLQQRNGPPILDLAEQIANYDSPDMRPRAVLAMEVASLSRDWSGAAALARRLRSAKHTFDSHPGGAVWRFHEAIWLLKTGKAVPRSDRRYLRRAAQLNPLDHRHKFLVVEAETLRARGDPACLTAFGVAVEAALASSSRLEAGVAAELACEAAREFGQAELAERHAARAQEIWSGWGALAKLALRAAGARPHELATPLVEAQAEVEAARLQDRAKSRLLAEVAHELRTPLQGMQGLLDLAADDQALLDVGAFREVFASLRAVIDDLTDYGAVTSGEAPLASFKVDLAALIRSEVAVASSLEALRHARIEVELAGEAPAWIRTDAPRVRQVLRNLLSNAAKYGGGEFVLVRLEVLGKAESGLVDLAISVEDSGPGLGAGDSLLLFEPFERGSRQGDGAGLGLGLALSRKIARRLGGDLTGENRSEGGARFVFSFQAPEAKDDSTRDPARPARELRIVVADDIELSRRVVSAILRRRGHGVVEARDGIEALNAIADGPCDLAILDMAMPGASGVEVLRRLGAGAGGGRPASILLTASSLQEVGEDAKAAGVDLVLRKPVSADDLDRALASLFQDQRREDADLGAGLAAELARLAGLARMELRERIGDLLVHLGQGDFPDSAADAHRIAGLAAQFGWSQIAEAADALELALKCGSGEAKSKAARLQAAAQALEDGRSAA